MIFLPLVSSLVVKWSEGDRWTYQKVTRVYFISQNYQLIFFINHQATPALITLFLPGVRLQDWLQVSSRLASWTIETLFLTLDHSPHPSHLTPHLRDEQYLDTIFTILLDVLSAAYQTLPIHWSLYSLRLKRKNKNTSKGNSLASSDQTSEGGGG